MKWFVKLNLMSAFFAIPFLLSIELMVNVYRISRVTGWDIDRVNKITNIYQMAGFVVTTLFFLFLVNRWMEGRTARYVSILLSILYLFMFIYIIKKGFPITFQGDKANPVSGLIILGEFLLFPLYIAVINVFGKRIMSSYRK